MKTLNALQVNKTTFRRIILFLALICIGNLYAYQLNAQVICDQAFTARDSSILSPVNQQASTSGITYIKLYFHAYHAVFEGQDVGVDIQRCRDMRDLLNDQFEGTGFQFFFNECEFEIINDNYRAVVADFVEI
jgi:hypothetical protein